MLAKVTSRKAVISMIRAVIGGRRDSPAKVTSARTR